MNRLCLTLVVLAIAQCTSAQTVDDVTNSLKPMIDESMSSLGLTIGVSRKLIGEAYGTLNDNINAAVNGMNQEILELQTLLANMTSAAQESGKNIEQCVNAESSDLTLVNMSAIENCRSVPELTVAQKKLPELGMIRPVLRSLLPRCVIANQMNAENIKSCLEDGLGSVDTSIDSVSCDLQSLTIKGLESGTACIKTGLDNIRNSLQDIEKNLRTCVEAVSAA